MILACNIYARKIFLTMLSKYINVISIHSYFLIIQQQKSKCSLISSMLNPSTTNSGETPSSNLAPKKSWKSIKQTKLEYERRQKKAEKAQKRDEQRARYLEKQEAIKAYKKKKAERFKVLSKKTKRGQPIMAGRMEMLLEKIKAQTA